MKATSVASGVCAVLVAVAAGCGGGNGGDGLSKDELISQADEICEKYAERQEVLQEGAPEEDPTAGDVSDETWDRAAEFLRDAADLVRDQTAELRELEPPEEDEADWDENLERLESVADSLDEGAQAAADKDRDALVRIFRDVQRVGAEADRYAREYGFRECGAN